MSPILQMLIVLFLSIFIHELTHYLFAQWTGDFIKIDFDEGSPTVHFNDQMTIINQLIMYGLAIAAGIFVIIPFIFYTVNGYIHILTLFVYLFGCRYDFYEIINLIQGTPL